MQEYFRDMFLFCHENALWLNRINENTQHTIILLKTENIFIFKDIIMNYIINPLNHYRLQMYLRINLKDFVVFNNIVLQRIHAHINTQVCVYMCVFRFIFLFHLFFIFLYCTLCVCVCVCVCVYVCVCDAHMANFEMLERFEHAYSRYTAPLILKIQDVVLCKNVLMYTFIFKRVTNNNFINLKYIFVKFSITFTFFLM